MREWLIELIREAVRAEMADQLRALDDKATRTELALSSIAVRVKEKQEQKPQRPRTWGEAREKLESRKAEA